MARVDEGAEADMGQHAGLDVAVLGLAQADRHGNLNVSKFGTRLAGAGGFINISRNAKKVVFVGTFTAGDLQVAIEDGVMRIVREGSACKFVEEVEHRTYSGIHAAERGQVAIYVTERCVFQLTADGLEGIENDNFPIAPELMDDYIAMVRDLTGRFYSRVTRYTTSTDMRSYFGRALRAHDAEPALYATPCAPTGIGRSG